jgi:hypothetical protein
LGSGHVFVVLGAHARVLTPINGCHFNVDFAWTSMMFILGKAFFYVHVKMAFVLTSTMLFNIWTLFEF